MKRIVLFMALAFQGILCAQTPHQYQTFQGEVLDLYRYDGQKTVLLSSSNTLNATGVNRWLTTSDAAYNYFYECIGQHPACQEIGCLDGKTTLARVAETCGQGCGQVGAMGLEFQAATFDAMYNRILSSNQFDEILFYEFAQNFWFLEDKLQYSENDPVRAGFAAFMRFMAMEELGVNAAPYNGSLNFTTYKNQIRNLRATYSEDDALNWANTLGMGQGVPDSGYGAPELFASFCFYFRETYGANWVKDVWKQAALRPVATSTQDAVDNFIIACSLASNMNQLPIFQFWKWTPSQAAIDYLNTVLGVADIDTAIPAVFYPNPVQDLLYFDREFDAVEIFSQDGKQISKTNAIRVVDLSNYARGIYFLRAKDRSGKPFHAKIVKQ